MARQDPRAKPSPIVLRKSSTTAPAPGPEFADGDDTFAWLGERLRRLALGLVAMLFVARAYFPSEDAATGSGLSWDFALLATSALAVASFLFAGTTRLRWSWADAAVLALVLLVANSATHAAERRAAIAMAWEWGAMGLLYVLARNLPRTRAESAALAGVVVATAVAVAAYGLYQVPVELAQLRRLFLARPEYVLLRQGLTPGSPSAEALKQRLFSLEPFSTFALANSLAGFLVGPMALAFAIALENLRREGRGSRLVALAMAAVPGLAILACLMLTKSRSASAGLAVALLVLGWRARKAVPPKVLVAAVLGLGALVGPLVAAGVATKQLDVQVLTEWDKSLRYRWEYWVGAWGIITDAPSPYASTGLSDPSAGLLDKPGAEPVVAQPRGRHPFWSGVGPANFAGPYLRHKLPQASEEVQDPHNMILEVWVDAGIFAALALLAALAIGLRELLGPGRASATAPEAGAISQPAKPRDDPSAPPLRAGWLVGAGGLGWLAVWALGKLNPVTQNDLLFRWLILGAAWGLAILLGAPLWRRRPIPAAGLGVAVLALSINLLAAGGIGMPSVAMGLWVLLALGLNLRDDRPCGRLRDAGGLGPSVALACVWAMLAGTFFGAVVPAWKADAALAEGNAAMRAKPPAFEAARGAYIKAIQADHYDTRPWLALAELEFHYWQSPEVDKRKSGGAWELPGVAGRKPGTVWERVLIAVDDALDPRRRNPDNIAIRRRQADFARMILKELPDPKPFELLQLRSTIVRACRHAARLYPTSAFLRYELAKASADIGMFPDAVREARQALLLDGLTPHLDKKLPTKLRADLNAQIGQWEAMAQAPPPPLPKPPGRK